MKTARDVLERFECREQCAERGEPPCFEIDRQADAAGIKGPAEFPCNLCARLTTARLSALSAAGFKVLGREQTNEMADAISDGPAHSVIGSDGVQHWGTLVSSATAWRTMFDAAEPQEKP